MLTILKDLIRRKASNLYRVLKVHRDLIWFKDSYIHTTGYYKSALELSPCKPDGSPIPWMNYAVVKLLESSLQGVEDIKLFEYGSGSSTIFFANIVKQVFSCEHDSEWFNRIKAKVPQNVSLMYRQEDEDGMYCRAINDVDDNFDIVVVDGRDRPNCIKQALYHLTDRGIVILDDSHRQDYEEVLGIVRNLGFRTLTIEGMKPLVKRTHSTTICYKDKNCLGL
jgi:predicted O-methyltransferase YrrM